MRTTIPDPDDMNEQRADWAESALRHYAVQVSGAHAFDEMRNADEVTINLLCDLAHLADERGWRLVDLLRVARSRYALETEDQGEQFSGFEQLVVPRYEVPRKPVQRAEDDEDELRRAS